MRVAHECAITLRDLPPTVPMGLRDIETPLKSLLIDVYFLPLFLFHFCAMKSETHVDIDASNGSEAGVCSY
jgi:hypothetical protein